jgi:hypothetical protein
MENRKQCIEIMQQMTAIIRGMQADILVIKECIARDIKEKQEEDLKTNDLFETALDAKDDGVYMINPEKMMKFMEQYKI